MNDNDRILNELEDEMYNDLYHDYMHLKTHPDYKLALTVDPYGTNFVYGYIYRRRRHWYFWYKWEIVDYFVDQTFYFSVVLNPGKTYTDKFRRHMSKMTKRLNDLFDEYLLKNVCGVCSERKVNTFVGE